MEKCSQPAEIHRASDICADVINYIHNLLSDLQHQCTAVWCEYVAYQILLSSVNLAYLESSRKIWVVLKLSECLAIIWKKLDSFEIVRKMGNHLENLDSFEIARKIGNHLENLTSFEIARKIANHLENFKTC